MSKNPEKAGMDRKISFHNKSCLFSPQEMFKNSGSGHTPSCFPCRPNEGTLYTVNCTLYTVHYTLYTVHYTLYTVHCTLYTVHCTLYIIHCTQLAANVAQLSPNLKHLLEVEKSTFHEELSFQRSESTPGFKQGTVFVCWWKSFFVFFK